MAAEEQLNHNQDHACFTNLVQLQPFVLVLRLELENTSVDFLAWGETERHAALPLELHFCQTCIFIDKTFMRLGLRTN
jgi:hypothetical protein